MNNILKDLETKFKEFDEEFKPEYEKIEAFFKEEGIAYYLESF